MSAGAVAAAITVAAVLSYALVAPWGRIATAFKRRMRKPETQGLGRLAVSLDGIDSPSADECLAPYSSELGINKLKDFIEDLAVVYPEIRATVRILHSSSAVVDPLEPYAVKAVHAAAELLRRRAEGDAEERALRRLRPEPTCSEVNPATVDGAEGDRSTGPNTDLVNRIRSLDIDPSLARTLRYVIDESTKGNNVFLVTEKDLLPAVQKVGGHVSPSSVNPPSSQPASTATAPSKGVAS